MCACVGENLHSLCTCITVRFRYSLSRRATYSSSLSAFKPNSLTNLSFCKYKVHIDSESMLLLLKCVYLHGDVVR